MKRSLPLVLGAVLLLTMGIVVGTVTSSVERPEARSAPPPLRSVPPAEPVGSSSAPVLVARADSSARDRELAALREQLDGVRVERDQLAAEIAKLREQAKRWEALAELERAQRAASEATAVATSRNTISAQAQMQASAKIDDDRDGTGEYAGFLEMSGGAVGRMATREPLVPPVMSSTFRTLTKHGEAYRSGYLYRIFLPDARGNGVGEGPEGFLPSQVDASLAETTWCMYAWPAVGGEPAGKTFFMNQAGDVLATEDPRYAGSGNGPEADAAFRTPGIAGPVAFGVPGNDGNTWRQVN